MIVIIAVIILVALAFIFMKPIIEGIKEGIVEAKEEVEADTNIENQKINEEWAIFYEEILKETEFFERFSLALAQPYRKIFTNTDLTKLNASCFSFKKLSEKQLTELKSVIKRDFGVIDKQTLTDSEKNFSKNIDTLKDKLQEEPNFALLLDNFSFSTPYRMKFQFETELHLSKKEKNYINNFENKYHLGIYGAEGFKIGVLSYLYTSSYELDFINKYELKEYMEILISEAQELFDSWEIYGESFKIGEYSARLNNALGRKAIELNIKNLIDDQCTPWQNMLWD